MKAMTTPASSALPAPLLLSVHDLFEQHHAQALLPAVLAVVQPHLTDTPVEESTWMDAAMQRRIVKLLAHHRQLHLLVPVPVLDLVGPYLAQPAIATTPAPTPTGQAQLTARELEVLTGMSAGRPNSAIGRPIGLSEDTIKYIAGRLFRKLGARDRAHAVAIGFSRGYLQADPSEVAA